MWLLVVIVVALLLIKHITKKDTNFTGSAQIGASRTPNVGSTNSLQKSVRTNDLGERMDKLTPDGELPWGWLTKNQDFIRKAEAEYGNLFSEYAKHQYGDPQKRYAGLKSLLLYIEDAKKHYAQKGECYLYWFESYWVQDEEVKKLYSELQYMEEHYDELKKEYERKQYIENILIPELKKKAIEVVKENPGIIQTDAYGFFDPDAKSYVQEVFRILSREGKIKREKQGRTYKLSI